jgi:ABC-type lipoprotein release transport system permease subunit
VYGEPSKEVRGRVLDENGDPLQNVTASFWQVEEVRSSPFWVPKTWKPSLSVKGFLETTVMTDANGFFNATLSQTISWSHGYRLYVYTEGFRYIPLVRYYEDLSLVPEDLSFQLMPAASFILDSEVLIVDSTMPWQPPQWLIFHVTPVTKGTVYDYCDPTDSYFGEAHSYFLGLEPGQVIVPANTSAEIRVSGVTSYYLEAISPFSNIFQLVPISVSFNIERLPILKQGQIFHIDIREYSLQYNSLVVQNLLQEVETLLEQAEQKGFYASAERRDLTKSRNLLISAESNRVEGLYADSYADILQAYQIGSQLTQRINDMYQDATVSAIFFPLFFAFTAVAVVSLVFESKKLKALMTFIVYGFFLMSFYYLYPGSRVADISLLIESSIGFISAVLIFSMVLPRLVKETAVKGRIALRSAIVALFSLAKRNMKRRRLRSILTLAVVTISITAFVALTSFSVEYGLMVKKSSRSPPAEGLLVRANHTLPSKNRETVPFAPMSESDIVWLAARDRAVSVAPRSENPRKRVIQNIDESGRREYYDPLGNLALSQNEKMFFSVIGIVPSAEASATHLDSVVKIGRYLNDNESNAILLSEKAANELGADVGDELLWSDSLATPLMSGRSVLSVKLVGIFEDSSLDNLRDLDGQRFLPQKILEKRVTSSILDRIQVTKSLINCFPDEVIITTYQSAYNFSDSVYLSRVDVSVDNPENILPFARELVLMRNFRVWASIGESLHLYELGSYAEIGGSGIIIALIIVMLTIGTTMSASVYERRREMNVLSAVGLNPSHITMLFVDQAIIIGLIGGALGYLLGTGLYQVFILFPTDIVVRQKLSLGWSFVALTIGIAATTLGTAIPAIKASVLVTPSLLRRWKIEKKPSSAEEPYIFEMPVKVRREDINDFVNYLTRRLLDYKEGDPFYIKRTRRIHEKTTEEFITRIKFTYFYGFMQAVSFLATNDITVTLKKNEDVSTVRLASRGAGPEEEKHIRKIASLIRNFILEWSSEKTSH